MGNRNGMKAAIAGQLHKPYISERKIILFGILPNYIPALLFHTVDNAFIAYLVLRCPMESRQQIRDGPETLKYFCTWFQSTSL